MLQKIAYKIATYSAARSWIDSSKIPWCQYALEKQLGALFFLALCVLLAIITSKWLELFTFVSVLYIFRQRLGGWHTKHFWSCQLVGLGVVIVSIKIVGPMLEALPSYAVLIINLIALFVAFFIRPVYPTSAHFPQEIRQANSKQKNRHLLILAILQCLSVAITLNRFLIYSCLGLTIVVASVMLEYMIKRGEKNEKV